MSFYQTNNKILYKSIKGVETIDFNKYPDLLDILFNHWISQKENYNRLNSNFERGEFEISRTIIMEEFGIKDTKAKNLIKRFVKDEIIKLKKRGSSSSKKSIYVYLSALEDVVKTHKKKTKLETKSETKKKPSETLENEYIHSYEKPSEDQAKDQVKDHSKKELIKRINKKEIYSRVITRLNELTGKSYKPTTKKTIACIDARLREGFIEYDFYKVIEIKTKEWLGTNMEMYLRPETLFGNKFEGYLNQKTKDQHSTEQPNEECEPLEIELKLEI